MIIVLLRFYFRLYFFKYIIMSYKRERIKCNKKFYENSKMEKNILIIESD